MQARCAAKQIVMVSTSASVILIAVVLGSHPNIIISANDAADASKFNRPSLQMVDIHYFNLVTIYTTLCYAIAAFPSLQIFSGALTEIRCSATAPTFLLNERYGSREYDQLPGLFGIEVELVRSINGSSPTVMLRVNGTSQSNNVTVMCRNLIDPLLLQTETLFTLLLVYIGEL